MLSKKRSEFVFVPSGTRAMPPRRRKEWSMTSRLILLVCARSAVLLYAPLLSGSPRQNVQTERAYIHLDAAKRVSSAGNVARICCGIKELAIA